ncbi:MAG TPA: hypothetical protein VE621_22780 [Bryobacteraceae bacterium]|nr:hypothetical protein [Bryobacteraceae bacterium]
MRALALLMLVGASLFAESIPANNIKRSLLESIEKNIDRRLDLLGLDDPFLILGQTRGVYLDGYGAVFTTELNLIASANLSPFRPSYTKEELQRIHQKKVTRLVALKKNMRDLLVNAAATLDTVPMDEKIALGITLFYFNWEDHTGLPKQVLMVAPKRALLSALKGENTELDAALKIQDIN